MRRCYVRALVVKFYVWSHNINLAQSIFRSQSCTQTSTTVQSTVTRLVPMSTLCKDTAFDIGMFETTEGGVVNGGPLGGSL
jgi:hypothetical protein